MYALDCTCTHRYNLKMTPRRAQAPISFRSDRAAARLKLLTRTGRSQAEVIEEALELAADPLTEGESRNNAVLRLRNALHLLHERTPPVPSMAEFDANEYDEHGNPR
jgi:hypothetical protein